MTVLISSPSVSAVSAAGSPRPVPERRLRKKEQNKTAAQRYREKKRSEHGTVLSEYELLEKRNTELRAKVDDMSKEIAYLKGLIEEICA
jgi:cyclic AMP-dependent transcription factor ATF-4